MNDPQVVTLIYRTESGDYEIAKSFVPDEPEFRVKIKDKEVCFELKKHYATESEARKSIAKYIRAWEQDILSDAIFRQDKGDYFRFRLKFDRPEIVDRNPTPGEIDMEFVWIEPGTLSDGIDSLGTGARER